jgi:ABC-type bacteriocin/lantibiotic exporter with double-glycine peptidase domain
VGQVTVSWVVLVIFVVAGVAFTGVMQILQLTISENLQRKIFSRSAFEFAYRIPRMKMEAVDQAYIPELVNRFFDTLSIQKGLSKILIDFSSASLQVIFGLVLLSFYHPFFILFSMLLVAAVYIIFRFTIPQGIRTSVIESKYKYEVAHWLEELARAMETFKLAGRTAMPMERTDATVTGYLKARKAHFRTLMIQYINLVGFKVVMALGLLVIGGLLVINQQMNIGQFVAAEIIIILVLASVEKLILSMETIYDVLTAMDKIGSVTDIPLESDSGELVPNTDQGFEVSLNKVVYRFRGAKVPTLKGLDFHIPSGSNLCISGYSGSGKSVLLNLVAGLYENYQGTITYNRIPMGNWNKEQLHSQIGDCLTKEDIFNGSIRDNISLGKENVDFLRLQEVAEVVGLNPFLESLSLGFDTQLLPEGRQLPRTVRLKIMLARSIAAFPKLVLLEENLNQLPESDKIRFLEYLLDKKQKWTVIAVSNDPYIAAMFNEVIVLKEGEVMAKGKFTSFADAPWYSSIYATPQSPC